LVGPPIYHINVKSSIGDVHSEFLVSEAEFERAKKWSVMIQQMNEERGSIPTDVYIIVKVCDLRNLHVKDNGNEGKGKGKGKEGENEVKIVFLVDPWDSYYSSRLVLRHKRKLVRSIFFKSVHQNVLIRHLGDFRSIC
jgi:hypothetical protein